MALEVMKRIFQKKMEQIKEDRKKASPELTNLPFRPNSLVSFNELDFILLKDVNFKIPKGDYTIQAIGKLHSQEFTTYRFYLNEESFIEVIDNPTAPEMRFFSEYDIVYPDKDWDVWINEETGIIGDFIFTISDDNNIDTDYLRMICSDTQNRIEPIMFDESIYLDEYDTNPTKIEHFASMYYGKIINSEGETSSERLHLSAISDEDGSCITIYTGIQISPSSINII